MNPLMNSYMVVATFKVGVTQEEIRALIPAEQVQAKLLEEQGLLGSIKVFPTTPPAGSIV